LIAEAEERGTPTLLDYLLVLRRWKWSFLLPVVLVPAIAVFISARKAPTYEASAQVLLQGQNVAESLSGVSPGNVDPARAAQTEADLARVPEVARRALAEARVLGLTPQKLLKSSSVSASASSDFLRFSVTNPDPAVARSLATGYAQAFTDYRHDLDTEELAATHQSVLQRIERLDKAGLRGSALYRSLVQKEQELTSIEALQTSSARLVDPAVRTTKIGSQKVRNGLIGLALGLVLGLMLAFLRDALDTRVRSLETIRKRLGLLLLGSLPAPPRRLARADRLVMTEAPMSHEAEPFRSLRASLDFANADARARTIMVTSAVDAEGKSTTVGNLAVALARAGRHVVLVDFDLRSPYIHRLFDLPERPGLIDIELGNTSLEDALRPVALAEQDSTAEDRNLPTRRGGRLEVLPAGHPIKDPDGAELEVAITIERLRDRADVVLIDAAPLLPVGDTIALSAYVDAIILVVRLNALRSSALDDLRRILSSSPAAKLGFVLTGAPIGEEYAHSYRFGPPKRRLSVASVAHRSSRSPAELNGESPGQAPSSGQPQEPDSAAKR
jgi:polysaccharide biosynthesis transport protein